MIIKIYISTSQVLNCQSDVYLSFHIWLIKELCGGTIYLTVRFFFLVDVTVVYRLSGQQSDLKAQIYLLSS